MRTCGGLGVRFKPFLIPGPEASEGLQGFHTVRPAFDENRVSSINAEVDDSRRAGVRSCSITGTASDNTRPVCLRLQQGSTEHRAEGRYTRMEASLLNREADVRQTTVPRNSKIGAK
jgi:hypothetical protein